MPRFAFTSLLDDGNVHHGEMTAASAEAVVQFLEGQHEHAIRVTGASGLPSLLKADVQRPGAYRSQVAFFTRQLAWLLKAGLSLPKAIEALAAEFTGTAIVTAIQEAHSAIRAGGALSESLERYPRYFSPDYVSMVRLAEASGTLATTLEQLAAARERDERVRRKLTSAMIYPAVLIAVAGAAVLFILIGVVPRIKGMLVGSPRRMPDATARLISLSDWVSENGWILLATAGSLLALVYLTMRYPPARLRLANTALRLPVIGTPFRLTLTVRFARSLTTLLSAGLNLPEALALVASGAGGGPLSEAAMASGQALRKGEDFVAPLASSKLFPGMFMRVLRIGEETGNLVPSLTHAAAAYEEQLSALIDRASRLLEPAVILALSVIIGLIISAVMDGIISVNDLAF